MPFPRLKPIRSRATGRNVSGATIPTAARLLSGPIPESPWLCVPALRPVCLFRGRKACRPSVFPCKSAPARRVLFVASGRKSLLRRAVQGPRRERPRVCHALLARYLKTRSNSWPVKRELGKTVHIRRNKLVFRVHARCRGGALPIEYTFVAVEERCPCRGSIPCSIAWRRSRSAVTTPPIHRPWNRPRWPPSH